MENPSGDADVARDREEPDVEVTACETRPGRVVFTEADNTDAWIATDLTVDVDR
jgi:hypothetical protein